MPHDTDRRLDFKSLVERHQEKVRNTCYRFVNNSDDADDLTQEVFVQVFESLPHFREESELSTWIYRIAVNKSLDFIRRQNRRKRFARLTSLFGADEGREEVVAASDSTPHQELEEKELRQILQQAVERLPENQRTAIVLSKYDWIPHGSPAFDHRRLPRVTCHRGSVRAFLLIKIRGTVSILFLDWCRQKSLQCQSLIVVSHRGRRIAHRNRIPYIGTSRSGRGGDQTAKDGKTGCMKKIKILLVEDNRILRDGIKALLSAQSDLSVVGASGGHHDTLLQARRIRPHVVLIDLGLRSENGLHIVSTLARELPQIRVIGMGLMPSQHDIIEFVESGAAGFLLKDATIEDVLGTIRSVARGTRVLPPPLAESLFTHVVEQAVLRGKGTLPDGVRMTKREREIILLIAEGMSNKEIAQRLSLSTYTVKSHVHNILEKMALHSRLQIATHFHDSRKD